MQPYLSVVNGVFKDHGLETVALGDLVAKVESEQLHKSRLMTHMYAYTYHHPTPSKPSAWPKPYNSSSKRQQRVLRYTLPQHANMYGVFVRVRQL
jgi:hypothetical protein